MNTLEKIILVDDEGYEVKLLNLSLEHLQQDYEVIYFSNPVEAFDFLAKTDDAIFLIISDMNMPGQNGLEFKRRIDADPKIRKKSLPFIFFSSSATQAEVDEAYEYHIQGYFKKPLGVETTTRLIQKVIEYWKECRHPNKPDHS